MSKQSSAPWSVDHDGPSLPIVVDSAGNIVALVRTNEVDAALIATSPKLLNALRKAVDTTYSDTLYAEWKALIAEAEGRTT